MTDPRDPTPCSHREAGPKDQGAIAALLKGAFEGSLEADLVQRLRGDNLVIAELLAHAGDRLIGQALFSKLTIASPSGQLKGAALAPLAVRTAARRKGVAAALVRAGLSLCQKRQVAAVLVLGDPAYYARFGFSSALARGLQAPYAGDAFMALELAPACLQGSSLRVTYPEPFAELDRDPLPAPGPPMA